MHKLLRLYNQNRIKVWSICLAIIFILVVIQVFNSMAEKKQNEQSENDTNIETSSYKNESKSIITDNQIPKDYQDFFGTVIDRFYTYCINHEPENAYELLASDTKELLYQTEKQFEKLYYEGKFSGNKQYSFQAWISAKDKYVYKVKIYDNMLQTGKSSENSYIEDYITIVPVEDSFKLNINSYMGRKMIQKKGENENLTAEVVYSDQYIDYEIYTFRIKNNTNSSVILDSREETDTTYIVDNNKNKFESFLYENKEEDLILKPQESKTVKIKFNDAYRTNMKIEKIYFTDIYIGEKEGELLEISL